MNKCTCTKIFFLKEITIRNPPKILTVLITFSQCERERKRWEFYSLQHMPYTTSGFTLTRHFCNRRWTLGLAPSVRHLRTTWSLIAGGRAERIAGRPYGPTSGPLKRIYAHSRSRAGSILQAIQVAARTPRVTDIHIRNMGSVSGGDRISGDDPRRDPRETPWYSKQVRALHLRNHCVSTLFASRSLPTALVACCIAYATKKDAAFRKAFRSGSIARNLGPSK